jgi:hypothetical protein
MVPCCCVLLAFLCGACSRKASPSHATGGPTAGASIALPLADAARPKIVCKAKGTSFSLGPVDAAGTSEGDGDSEGGEDLPFGVTVGRAQSYEGGYVVSAIDARQDGSHAVLALLDLDVARGKVLDLGRVYGDAEPPGVIVRNDEAFVVVPDTDASGRVYRYAWVRGLDAGGRVEWLGSFEQAVDDSAVFGLANTESTITITWDEVDQKTRQSYVRWASLDRNAMPITSTPAPTSLSKRKAKPSWTINSTGHEVDAEAPQLVARQSGYWLAYLASAPETIHSNVSSGHAASALRAGQPSSDSDVRAIELGRRGVALLPLDASGHVNGKPIFVTEPSAHVVTFDIEATTDDGAIVVYRDADTTPGVEEQVIEVVRVRPDGGLERHRIDDERVGAGMPVLLIDKELGAAKPSRRGVWLAVPGSAIETRIAELSETGPPVLELVEVPVLGGVEPMLRRGDSLLVARHRARFVQFERMDCTGFEG